MAASRQKMEFELKKELYEAIAPGFACSVCKILPKEGPLYICGGHIFCITCKIAAGNGLKDLGDAYAIPGTEKLLQTLPSMAACRYQKNGCQIIQDRKNISYHEEDCPVRDVECIFLHCEKIVPASKLAMAKHFRDGHSWFGEGLKCPKKFDETKYTLDGQKITICPDPSVQLRHFEKGNNYRWTEGPIGFNEKMFFLQMEIRGTQEQAFVWLQMFGSKFEAKNYRYSVQLQEKQDLGTLIYKGPVKSLDDSKTKVFESKVGLTFSFEVVKQYLDENGLTFELEIENLKPKDDDVESTASFNGE